MYASVVFLCNVQVMNMRRRKVKGKPSAGISLLVQKAPRKRGRGQTLMSPCDG